LGDTLPIAAIQIMPKDPTGGAVDTLVKAEKHIEGELIIGNCDQLVAFDVNDFVEFGRGYDGCFVTFKSNKDHHSYVKKKYGIIKQIKEKEVISNEAVTGVYYFKNPSNFFAAAHKVVDDNILVRGEFYVSSVIDRMIEEGYRFSTYEAPSAMLGTPEELQLFEAAVEVGKELI
jgi:dTDP-glucose pyrophosphorylase